MTLKFSASPALTTVSQAVRLALTGYLALGGTAAALPLMKRSNQ